MSIRRIAMLSVHTSPLAPLGGKKTGGMNVYIRELAQEFGTRGIQVDIFTRRHDPQLPEIDYSLGENVRVIHINSGPPFTLDPDDVYPHIQQFTSGVIAFTTRERINYDLLYSHYWLSGLVAHSLNEIWNTPFVQMFHTLGHMKNRIAAQPMRDGLRTTMETHITRWATHLIAATPAEQAQLIWLYRADRQKIAIVPPGVNTENFYPRSHRAAKKALGIPADQQLLLFVGRIEPLKAVDSILEALHNLRQTQPHVLENVRFAIVGGDPDNPQDREYARIKALTAQFNLSGMVDFLGAKDHHALSTYYGAATALIMPSDYESFGMVALEAMASGTPVIASEVGGLGYLVRDGETGFLVPVRDPQTLAERIASLLSDTSLRQRMGANAAVLGQAYAWPTIADQLLDLFEEIKLSRQIARVR
jgi:D-inositol-3-phosphate glycosyltransferase